MLCAFPFSLLLHLPHFRLVYEHLRVTIVCRHALHETPQPWWFDPLGGVISPGEARRRGLEFWVTFAFVVPWFWLGDFTMGSSALHRRDWVNERSRWRCSRERSRCTNPITGEEDRARRWCWEGGQPEGRWVCGGRDLVGPICWCQFFYSERECMCVGFESNGENRYDGLRVQTSHENIK
jgi:hypothetical protein